MRAPPFPRITPRTLAHIDSANFRYRPQYKASEFQA
jgi:hypothetical protein